MAPETRGGNRLAPIAEETWYLPIYLIDDRGQRASGHLSLFVRSYRLRDRKAGPLIQIATDVWEFEDGAAMVAAIERLGLQELPAEADGDRLYVPEPVALPDARVERTGDRIAPPEEALS